MLKPSSCEGCVFAKSRQGYVEDAIPSTAKLVLMMDVPQKSMVSGTAEDVYEAKYFRRAFQGATQLDDSEVGYAHLLRCKDAIGKTGKDLPLAIAHCRGVDYFPEGAVLVTNGPLGWKHFSGTRDSRKDWRGYCVEETT